MILFVAFEVFFLIFEDAQGVPPLNILSRRYFERQFFSHSIPDKHCRLFTLPIKFHARL